MNFFTKGMRLTFMAWMEKETQGGAGEQAQERKEIYQLTVNIYSQDNYIPLVSGPPGCGP